MTDDTTQGHKAISQKTDTPAAHAVENAEAVEQASEKINRSEPQAHDDYAQLADLAPQNEQADLAAEPVELDRHEAESGEHPSDEQGAEDKPALKKTAKRSTKKTVKKTTKKASRSKAAAQDQVQPEEEDSPKAAADQPDDEDETEISEPPRALESCRMVINYVPNEECRVALLENGRLEEFYSERMDAISRVNNIYVGRVANVESGIQAAFIDFGIGESGFLHVSDLHPRYFPGAEKDDSERVGRKTPRRERPPIQQALRKGQEIVVQVLKEGVGTKGPTLTSYLSIPGRYLVMMPQMDEVGVSRKVEDEQTRKEMRKILDTLDLPENFGFILRTAGLGKTKTELKRDLAYLQRLWKDLEKRLKGGKAPRLLYSESDLLLRALRDFLTPEVQEIVIDNEHALRRASQFLKIAAPRSPVKLHSYTGPEPAFYAFGIEEQIERMHSREVPLPSGGRLVIDQTEAVVAIDVNSGRMRSARDSETNALQTNLEAVDEICRQLRLRDLGGIVINDLIDMRPAKNRKLIEQRFKDRLKRDRARTTVATISQFGILEMTRQRMRGSQHSQTYTDCPTCHGRGSVKRPSSVASESMRKVATLLSYPKVARVELKIGPRVAGELLSKKRRTLNRLERISAKQIDVIVQDMVEPDRVVLYAYEANGVDIDIERLPAPRNPERCLSLWVDPDPNASWDETEDAIEDLDDALEESDPLAVEPAADERTDEKPASEAGGKKKRRRRRRGKRADEAEQDEESPARPNAAPAQDAAARTADKPPETESDPGDGQPEGSDTDEGENADRPKKKRRRRRRKRKGESEASADGIAATDGAAADASEESETDEDGDDAPAPKGEGDSIPDDPDRPRKKKRRRRRRGKAAGDDAGEERSALASSTTPAAAAPHTELKPAASTPPTAGGPPSKPKPRTLYGASRRKLSAVEAAKVAKRKD